MRILCLSVLACALGTVGKADVLYSFSYDAASGPLQSFAFSFTAPDFVTDVSSPPFTPFTLTDGSNRWTMTNDLIEVGGTGVGCFLFGTPLAQLTTIFGPCSFGVGGGDTQGAFVFATNGGLPSALGTYTSTDFTGVFATPGGGFKFMGPIGGSTDETGSMTLIISSVPEPSTVTLLALGLLVLWPLPKRAYKPER